MLETDLCHLVQKTRSDLMRKIIPQEKSLRSGNDETCFVTNFLMMMTYCGTLTISMIPHTIPNLPPYKDVLHCKESDTTYFEQKWLVCLQIPHLSLPIFLRIERDSTSQFISSRNRWDWTVTPRPAYCPLPSHALTSDIKTLETIQGYHH